MQEESIQRYQFQAEQYIEDVISGEIPACTWVKLACMRQIRDLQRQATPDFPYVYNPSIGARWCHLLENMPHVKGRWDSKCIQMRPWQVFIYMISFSWVNQNDDLRRFKTFYIEVPRKNAKSTMSAPVALGSIAIDNEEGAEAYSSATTMDQARIVFDMAKEMVRRTPQFAEAFDLEILSHSIWSSKTASAFKPLSAQNTLSSSLDGLNVHCAVIDELHAHKTRHVWDVIETATGSRLNPIIWAITTAGSNRSGICYEQRNYVTKILSGVHDDEEYFGIIYTIDDDDMDQWYEEKNLIKANPNWGYSVNPDDMRRKLRKAMQLASAQNNFKAKHLNIWVNADTSWMNMVDWSKCADETLERDDFKTERCVVGLDLASKKDIAARIDVFRRKQTMGGEEKYHYYVFGKYYLPEAALEEDVNSQYGGWEAEGRLISTPGSMTDYEIIKADFDNDISSIGRIGYDPHQATMLVTQLQKQGFELIEVRPTVLNFSEPMKELEALVIDKRLHHDGCPVLEWMISNVVCHIDAKDNIYPRKEFDQNKIDGVVALISALAIWLQEEINERSIYEDRGLTIL